MFWKSYLTIIIALCCSWQVSGYVGEFSQDWVDSLMARGTFQSVAVTDTYGNLRARSDAFPANNDQLQQIARNMKSGSTASISLGTMRFSVQFSSSEHLYAFRLGVRMFLTVATTRFSLIWGLYDSSLAGQNEVQTFARWLASEGH